MTNNSRINMEHSRQRKRYCLSTASLSYGDDVTPAQRHRPRLTLDWGWGGESLSSNGAQKIIWETNFIEASHGLRDITAKNLITT